MFKPKKTISLILSACLCFSSVIPCVAAEDSTEYATREYVISEFVQSVGRSTLDDSTAVLDMFSDAASISEEYRADVSRAVVGGILKGYDDRTIRPIEPISRIEAMAMLAR